MKRRDFIALLGGVAALARRVLLWWRRYSRVPAWFVQQREKANLSKAERNELRK
jgi:hypothetical protein